MNGGTNRMHRHRPKLAEFLAFGYFKGYSMSEADFANKVFSCKKCGCQIKLAYTKTKFFIILSIVTVAMLPLMALDLLGILMYLSNPDKIPVIALLFAVLIIIPMLPGVILYFTTKYKELE